MFFSLHGIIGLGTIFLIFLTGIDNFWKYKKTKNLLLLFHTITYFTGGFAFLLAVIPSFLHQPHLLKFLLCIGIISLAFGVASYVYILISFFPRFATFRYFISGASLGLGILMAFLILIFPPTISFTPQGWTIYLFPDWIKIGLLPFFSLCMAIGGGIFIGKGYREKTTLLKKKGILIGGGYVLIGFGVLLAVFGEEVIFNFLFLSGYLLIYGSTRLKGE